MRVCPTCGQEMVRGTFPSGRRETPSGFLRRTYCSIQCAQKTREKERCEGVRLSRIKAHRAIKSRCEACGVPREEKRLVVHHKDGDPKNNTASNWMTLCDSCHRHAHSLHFMDDMKTRKPCAYCAKPSKSKGVCTGHLERWRRYGHPLAKMRKTGFGSDWVLMLHDGVSWFPLPSQKAPSLAPPGSGVTAIPSASRRRKPSSGRPSTPSGEAEEWW